MEEQIYTLVSKDGSTLKIKEKAAKLSGLWKVMIQDDPNTSEIPVPNVDFETLTIVVDVLEILAKNEPFPTLEINKEMLNQLKDVSNYLDIKSIMDYVTQKLNECEQKPLRLRTLNTRNLQKLGLIV